VKMVRGLVVISMQRRWSRYVLRLMTFLSGSYLSVLESVLLQYSRCVSCCSLVGLQLYHSKGVTHARQDGTKLPYQIHDHV
jgi:hypothetical protein